jgi:hypothetical protein
MTMRRTAEQLSDSYVVPKPEHPGVITSPTSYSPGFAAPTTIA